MGSKLFRPMEDFCVLEEKGYGPAHFEGALQCEPKDCVTGSDPTPECSNEYGGIEDDFKWVVHCCSCSSLENVLLTTEGEVDLYQEVDLDGFAVHENWLELPSLHRIDGRDRKGFIAGID